MTSHLHLTVGVDERGELALQPAFVIATDDSAPQPQPQPWADALRADPRRVLTVEVVGESNVVLGRAQYPLRALCTEAKTPFNAIVATKILWSDEATAIRFYMGDRLIATNEVPTGRPEVKLMWEPSGPADGHQELSWAGSHSEGRRLHYLVLYSHTAGRSWEPLSAASEEDRLEVAFDDLPGGEGIIAVLASDGINTARAETRPFAVPVKPLFVVIQAPGDEDVLDAGMPVWFQGQAFDREAQAQANDELVWSSSLQGELGAGAQIIAELDPGRHRITLRAGRGQRENEATITVSAEASD